MYQGELVFTFLYDLGGEVRTQDLNKKLRGLASAERVEATKGAPSYVELVRPFVLRFPTRRMDTELGVHDVGVEARLHAIGAVHIVLRVPFSFATLDEVNRLTHARPREGPNLEAIARALSAEISSALGDSLVETYEAIVEPEAYLVVAFTQTPLPAIDLLREERQMLAGLVAGERAPSRLSSEEVEDNLRTWFRYYEDDLLVVDWDRALIVEPSGKYDDVLTVMEAANLELLELRAYDKYLDDVLEDAYEDISRFYGRGGLFRSARNVQEALSEARIDLVRVTDAINNIGKIFGDYYLAKVHLGLAERFHLAEWERIVREKMATLNELYTLASHEVEHRRGIALESIVVVLFVMDLFLIYLVSR